ncbi:UNVERIFIED_CONTAM: hypothetical protein Sradi_4052000 [Sesamum radiatum]|uniref:Reverse transcriptase n=1 Tax=Sesamum radiatum TaxID=300843 RepID=A0AAW2PNE4_SESRA
MSEVYGLSRDLYVAMEDFSVCLRNTGLLHVPMQGETYTWHNCSDGARSLWKRLDRMLANEQWLSAWPNIVCLSSTPRTSDHSPLIIRGYSPPISVRVIRFENYLAKQPGFLDLVTRKIATRRASQKVFRIMKDQGLYLTEEPDIVNEFIRFFETLLGGHRRSHFLNVAYLRPWARHIITIDKGVDLIHPVLRSEVKAIVFDIEEDKAPGPDGYSAAFYKAAWPVIGNELTIAVQDFFTTANEQSVLFFREGLETFAQWSGLKVNEQKSQLIVSKAGVDIKPRLLAILGFQEEVLAMQYLGLSLISSRVSATDCRPLLAKVGERIQGWGKLHLSFAARIQLIQSVLSALNTYWAMSFILPKGIIKLIETQMRNFLWQGGTDSGMAKVTWIRTYRLKNNTVWTANPNSGSWCRRKILRLRDPVLNCIRYEVGPRSERMVWKDPWHPLGVLIHRFPWGPQICGIPIEERLSVVMQDSEWAWPEILDIEHREITDMLPQIGPTDAVHWTSSFGFTTAEAYRLFHPPESKDRGGMALTILVSFVLMGRSNPMTIYSFDVTSQDNAFE